MGEGMERRRHRQPSRLPNGTALKHIQNTSLKSPPGLQAGRGFRATGIRKLCSMRSLTHSNRHAAWCSSYAKRTPLTDDEQWTIVGAGRITSIGDLEEWNYDPQNHGGLRSYLWERAICHSIRPDGDNGVLLPYHELLSRCNDDTNIDPSDCVAFVPQEYRREFSFASEHVSSGTAIAVLLAIKAALSNYNQRFGGDWTRQLKWIDQRLGELWTLRGPYPGLGSVLCAMGVEYGYQLAYHCWDKAGENGDPWTVLAELVKDPMTLPADLKAQIDGFSDTWKYIESENGRDPARPCEATGPIRHQRAASGTLVG